MSAAVVELRPGNAGASPEVPAVIAGSVNLVAFSGALARASIVGRYDADRGVLVLEPAAGRCRHRWAPTSAREVDQCIDCGERHASVHAQRCAECGGTGFDEDAACEFCDGTGRAEPVTEQVRSPAEALFGMAVYNGWTPAERARWHAVAESAVPADAVRAWERAPR